MNIYAIRDRLLNYFQQPFAAPEDTAVLAALSKAVTNGGDDVISQAPQHFEIWRLGKVEETGHITGRPEFLADLSALIRGTPGAGREPTGRTTRKPAEPARSGTGPTGAPTGAPDPQGRPLQDSEGTGHQPPQAAD